MNVKIHHFSIRLCVLLRTMVQQKCGIAFLHSWLYTQPLKNLNVLSSSITSYLCYQNSTCKPSFTILFYIVRPLVLVVIVHHVQSHNIVIKVKKQLYVQQSCDTVDMGHGFSSSINKFAAKNQTQQPCISEVVVTLLPINHSSLTEHN